MLEAHYATADDIDTAMKQGCALPMGPFELLDVVGNDVSLAIQRELYLEFREPGFAPAPLLEHLVTAGYLGRKTKHGLPRLQHDGLRGIRRRWLEGWLRTAPGAHHRRSLGDAVSAAAAAGVGHSVAATPPFTLPAGGGHRVRSGGSRLSCSLAGVGKR